MPLNKNIALLGKYLPTPCALSFSLVLTWLY